MNQTPILFLGDSPSAQGGLPRIGRDIATVASRMEEFRVGFLGRGGFATSKLPFMQYTYPEFSGWGEDFLQDIWEDFSKGEEGILFTIWDPSRLLWLNPRYTEYQWLKGKVPFKKWGYFPIDHMGPGGRLSAVEGAALEGFDRVLAYGVFGAQVISETLGWKEACDWLPHGINMDTFVPRDGVAVKVGLGIPEGMPVFGVVMTNQVRKDWGLAFGVIAELKKRLDGRLRVWCKSDSMDRHWDFRALAADFGVEDVVMVDLGYMSDRNMSYMYSMCDVTFLPSLGEGFGYPIVESLACGVPCVHGAYGGGAELLPGGRFLAGPVTMRFEAAFNCMRPVYDPSDWAELVMNALEKKEDKTFFRQSVEHLNWADLYTMWERWLREGLCEMDSTE